MNMKKNIMGLNYRFRCAVRRQIELNNKKKKTLEKYNQIIEQFEDAEMANIGIQQPTSFKFGQTPTQREFAFGR